MNRKSAVMLFLTVALVSLNASATSYTTYINAPYGLYQGDTLMSANGQYRLMLQPDGNLVVTRMSDGAIIWANNALGATVAVVQPDGNFVAYNTNTNPVTVLWNTATGGQGPGSSTVRLQLTDNGALNLWSSGSSLSWSTLGDSSCPGGGKRQLFTVCVGDLFTDTIPACSWSDALAFAQQYGTYVYPGRCSNGL